MESVFSVTGVCFNTREAFPLQITIVATGFVSTSGWGPGSLVPREYTTPPADGMQEFDFLATAPTGIVLQVLTPTSGTFDGELASWVKGLRVVAKTNATTVNLDEPGCVVAAIDASTL